LYVYYVVSEPDVPVLSVYLINVSIFSYLNFLMFKIYLDYRQLVGHLRFQSVWFIIVCLYVLWGSSWTMGFVLQKMMHMHVNTTSIKCKCG